jgi:hypothetical protein
LYYVFWKLFELEIKLREFIDVYQIKHPESMRVWFYLFYLFARYTTCLLPSLFMTLYSIITM